jgi:hypothetical protein
MPRNPPPWAWQALRASELMRPLRERHFINIKDGELIIERALSDLWCRLTRLNDRWWKVRWRRSNDLA